MITYVYRALLPALILAVTGCAARAQNSARPGSEARPGPVPPALPALTFAAEDNASTHRRGTHAVATQPATTQSMSDGPMTIRVAMSHAAYTKSEPKSFLLKVDYLAIANVPVDRPPLNVALVLDRSGSMAEDMKFPHLLAAVRWVVENMTDRDVLSIVAFNQRVVVLSAAGRVVNKPFLFHRLEEIEPAGSTDLSAGLLEGIAQVRSQAAHGQVQYVLLLTDGLANQGVTDPVALRRIAEKARAKGIGVSTFGCGTEFDEKLLSAMATAGGGRYTYVKSSEQIPTAFKDELHGLLQVVAQNATMEAVVSGGQITRVYGEPLDQPTRTYKVNIGDIRAKERGFFLMELKPSAYDDGAAVAAEVRLTFDDPQAGERITRVARKRSSFTSSPDTSALGEDQDVVIYGSILNALEQAEDAVQGLDTERYREARASFDRMYEQAHQRAIQSRDQELLNETFILKHLMGELAASEKEGLLHGHPEARAKLTKEGHYQRYLRTHHRPQP